MKIIIVTIFILTLSVTAFWLRSNFREYKNISYEIDGNIIGLRNGMSNDDIGGGGASSRISTRSIDYDTKADFNNDGAEDAAFMLVQYGGGTGTFYYLVAALKSEDTYKGTNAVFIGDRIKPQNIEFKDSRVIVYYLDRGDEEPFTANPTIKKIKYFKVEGLKLIEWN